MKDILAVVGSVKFAHPDGRSIAEQIIRDELGSRRPDVVTSGGAAGVDTLGERAAADRGIATAIFRPQVNRWHGPSGFRSRNLQIAHTCTRALRIVCAGSTTYGSGWTVDEAQRMSKPVRRVIVGLDGTVTDSGWPVQAAENQLMLNLNGG